MLKTAAPTLFHSASNDWPSSLRLVSGLILFTLFTGCVAGPLPYEEYTLARSAVRAAQEVDSAQFATGLWNRADDSFRRGEQAWNDNDGEKARKYFVQAQHFAESAENATRLRKFQTGDALP